MTSFAVFELRAARAAVNRTSNATAVWWPGGEGVGAPVSGIRVVFDREVGAVMGGMVNDGHPVASVFAPDMPGAKRGDAVQITPDQTGPTAPAPMLFDIKEARPDGAALLVIDLHGEVAR